MLYSINVPNKNGNYHIVVETQYKHTLEELKELLYKTNLDEDTKDDISFASSMTVENPQLKFVLIKHGFKVIEIKEDLYNE